MGPEDDGGESVSGAPYLVIPNFFLLPCSIPPIFQTADKGLSLFSIRLIALRIKTCHRQLFIYAVPRKRGPKATPTGGPEQSEWVSVAHNPKCWDAQDYKDFLPLDLRVKPEDDNTKNYPKMTKENKRPKSQREEILVPLCILPQTF